MLRIFFICFGLATVCAYADNDQLTNQINLRILPQLNLIPSQPQKVADLLEKSPTALAQTWLAFIYAGNYLRGGNFQEILAKNRPKIAAGNDALVLQTYDENAQELAKNPDQKKRMSLVIADIRMAYDVDTNDQLKAPLTYPCFVKSAYPSDYLSLFFYWGSSRDAQAPVDDCQINDPYSALPAYAKFSALIAKMDAKQGDEDMRAMLPGDPNAGDSSYVFGTMRFPIENTVLSDTNDIHNLLLTANPAQLMKLDTKAGQAYLAKFQKNKALALQYAEFSMVKKEFEQQVTQLLMQKFKINSSQAQLLAEKISLVLVEANSSELAFQDLYKQEGDQS